VNILENVPSEYAPYFEAERANIKANAASKAQTLLPSATIDATIAQSKISIGKLPSDPTSLASKGGKPARTKLGTVSNAASGFRSLPPRPALLGPSAANVQVSLATSEKSTSKDAGKRKMPETEVGDKRARTAKCGADNAANPDASGASPGPLPPDLPRVPSSPAFDVSTWKPLPFDENLIVVGQNVATIIQGVWQVGRISNLTYGKRKWVEYKNLPFVKSHKKGGGMVPPEYSLEFAQEKYGRGWVFVQEEWQGFLNMPNTGESV
jgi:hypothetical protein